MYILVLIIHILVAFTLMAVVLMQSGKGQGLAGAFGGGGGNQTLFGGRGAVDFLGKATWVLGAAFMLSSLSLAYLSGHGAGGAAPSSLLKKALPPASAPAAPGGGGGQGGGMPSGEGIPGGGSGVPMTPSSPSGAPSGAPSGPPAGAPAGGGGGK